MPDKVSRPVTDQAQRKLMILKMERAAEERAGLHRLLAASMMVLAEDRRDLRAIDGRIRRERQRKPTT